MKSLKAIFAALLLLPTLAFGQPDGEGLPYGAAREHVTAVSPHACRLSDGAAFYKGTTPADTQPVSGTFWQATQPVSGTVAATQSGTFTVQPGNTPNTTPWLFTDIPGTSGGLSVFHLVAAATTNATNVKASAGQLYCWYIYNSNAAARKVAFHNTAGTPTAGASVYFTMTIPATSGANACSANGIAFSTGIAITTVTGLADNDAVAVAANDLIINLFYK